MSRLRTLSSEGSHARADLWRHTLRHTPPGSRTSCSSTTDGSSSGKMGYTAVPREYRAGRGPRADLLRRMLLGLLLEGRQRGQVLAKAHARRNGRALAEEPLRGVALQGRSLCAASK
jgi:hypothetical protein